MCDVLWGACVMCCGVAYTMYWSSSLPPCCFLSPYSHSTTYLPDFVLHGTSQSYSTFKEDLIGDLTNVIKVCGGGVCAVQGYVDPVVDKYSHSVEDGT